MLPPDFSGPSYVKCVTRIHLWKAHSWLCHRDILLLFFNIFNSLFGCVRNVGSFDVACGLSVAGGLQSILASIVVESWCMSLVALRHVGSQFHDQGRNPW